MEKQSLYNTDMSEIACNGTEEQAGIPGKKICFVGNGAPMPFGQFLRGERERRGMEWSEFEVLCGCRVRGYAPVDPDVRVVHPTEEKLRLIAANLGYGIEQFAVQGLRRGVERVPEYGTPQYWAQARVIGLAILERNRLLAASWENPQLLSVPMVEESTSKQFARVHAGTPELRERLLEDLHTMEEFCGIQLQRQVQRKPDMISALTPFEDQQMRLAVNTFFTREGWVRWDRWPRGLTDFVHAHLLGCREEIRRVLVRGEDLAAIARERSRYSVVHHLLMLRREVRGIIAERRRIRGSPLPNGKVRDGQQRGTVIELCADEQPASGPGICPPG